MKRRQSNAVKILHDRYIKDDPERKASVESERVVLEFNDVEYIIKKFQRKLNKFRGLELEEAATNLKEQLLSLIEELEPWCTK